MNAAKKLGLLAFILFLPPITASTQSGEHLIISQVQITGGAGKTTNDFIEIHNPTNQDIDLDGYRLVKRTKTGSSDSLIKSFTDSAIIPAKGYFLWANASYAEILVIPDEITSASVSVDNGVALRHGPSDTGEIVDSVAWGSAENEFIEGAAFPSNPEADMAIKRKNNQDSDDNSQDFEVTASDPRNSVSFLFEELSDEPGALPEPEVVNLPLEKPQSTQKKYSAKNIIISEILPNPEGKDSGEEWIEFYNLDAEVVDVGGWILDDDGEEIGSSAYIFPENKLFSGFSFLLIELPSGSFALNNSGGDCARLFSPNEILQKEICYQNSAQEDKSYARKPDGSFEWTEILTPGSSNTFPKKQEEQVVIRGEIGKIVINELFPNPEDEEGEEYIELKNIDNDEIDVAGWFISDARRTYKISADDFVDTNISAGEYFVIPRTVSGIALNNSNGDEVVLFDFDKKEIDRVEYEESAKEEYSFSRSNTDDFLWTEIFTPGSANQFGGDNFEASEEEVGEVKGESKIFTTLEEVRGLGLGTSVEVTGQVASLPGALGKNIFYLAGSGMRIFLDGAEGLDLKLGDLVNLSGQVSSYHNETQIKVLIQDNIRVVGHTDPKSPVRIETQEVGEEWEGELVMLSGEIVKNSGDTFFIDDGSGQARIYLMDSTGIEKPKMRKGDVAVVTGVVSQYNDDYRVLPRMQSDLEVGQVTVAQKLPRTGVDYWARVLFLIVTALVVFEIGDYILSIIKKRA